MRKKNFKGRCIKKTSTKCKDICRIYDDIMLAYLEILENNDDIKEIYCNVILEDNKEYTTDFLCIKGDDEILIRECVFRNLLTKPHTANLLQISRAYWTKKGVSDWGLITNEEK